MALAASDFTVTSKVPLGVGLYLITGNYTGPASYASGGEDITSAIARAAFGVSEIKFLHLSPAVNTSTGAAVSLVYDKDAGTNLGKIRAINTGLGAHTHDVKVIGGQAATTTNELGHYATDILGKEAATDATIAGADSATKGGVVAAAASEAGAEVTATTDLSDYVGQFVLYGV